MSRKTVDKVKKDKPFHLLDLAVYGSIALAVIALFMAFVFFIPRDDIGKIFIDLDGKRIAEYDFNENELTVTDEEAKIETVETDGKITLTVRIDDKGYNVIEILTDEHSVSVTDANCSAHKDCVYSPAITSSKGIIVCVPHNLKIYGEAENIDNPVVG